MSQLADLYGLNGLLSSFLLTLESVVQIKYEDLVRFLISLTFLHPAWAETHALLHILGSVAIQMSGIQWEPNLHK